jgi:trehalose 6-phosphate phosphatase
MSRSVFPDGTAVLRAFCARGLLVAFDFDGTLAPLVSDRGRAAIPPGRRRRLRVLSSHVPVAVISGRGRADVAGRLRGTGIRRVVGGHGLDDGRPAAGTLAAVAALRREIAPMVEGLTGVELEDKSVALALHYRAAPDPGSVGRELGARLAALGVPHRRMHGHAVWDVLPPEGGGKGAALVRLAVAAGVDRAVYLGDDTTDEDVFSLCGGPEVLGVRVGPRAASAARLHLRSIDEVDALLDVLRDALSVGPAGIEPATERL